MDRAKVVIYGAKVAVWLVIAFGSFARAYYNHLEHKHLRWALVWLGAASLCLAASMTFRLTAVLTPDPHAAQSLLNSAWFLLVELGATVSAAMLFLTLQRPRRT